MKTKFKTPQKISLTTHRYGKWMINTEPEPPPPRLLKQEKGSTFPNMALLGEGQWN